MLFYYYNLLCNKDVIGGGEIATWNIKRKLIF